MLNMSNLSAVADNTIVINGVEVAKLTDDQTTKLIAIIKGFQSQSVVPQTTPTPQAQTQTLHLPEEKPTPAPMVGEKVWQDDDVTVTLEDGKYRLYITNKIPKVKQAIKNQAKNEYGAEYAGNFKMHNIFWVFPDKDSAELYVLCRKERKEQKEKEKA